jgi:hypothetical protein
MGLRYGSGPAALPFRFSIDRPAARPTAATVQLMQHPTQSTVFKMQCMCSFRYRLTRRHARIKNRGDGCAALVLQAEGQQLQPLLGITVSYSQVSTGLPQPAVRQQGRGLRVGSGFWGLVQPPPPSQRCRHRNLPGAHQGLQKGSPGPPKPLEPIHSLLAPTICGVDQQATRRPPIQSGATIYPSCLKSSQGVSPFLKATEPLRLSTLMRLSTLKRWELIAMSLRFKRARADAE